jgi:hypothetical protein
MPAKKPLTEEQRARRRVQQRLYAQTEKRQAKNREYQRTFRQTEKAKDYQRRYQESHREGHRERSNRYAASHREKINAKHAEWRATHKEHIAELNRQYILNFPEKAKAKWARYRLKRRSIAQVRTSPEEVYRRAIAALPSGLPRFIRDDVVSNLCLAILEGQINVNDMAAQARVFLRAYNRDYDTFQTVSLDVLIPGTKTTYLDALVAEP